MNGDVLLLNGHTRDLRTVVFTPAQWFNTAKGHSESRPSFGPPVGIHEVVSLQDLIRGLWQ